MKYFFLLAALVLAKPSYSQPRVERVELKDVNLYDALNFVFVSGDGPPHFIDDTAKDIVVKDFLLTNVTWDTALRQLANKYNYKIVRAEDRTWIVLHR